MEGFFYAAIASAPGIAAQLSWRLAREFGGAEAAWRAPAADIKKCIGEKTAESFLDFREKNPDIAEKIADSCLKKNIKIVTRDDKNYPSILKEIHSPPTALFYRGAISPDARRVAMVGARRATAYGERVAREISEGLAKNSVTVVSGAARGIDAASHEGALSTGRTVAVLGCGVDIAYPKENKKLLDEIAQIGAVISEYPPGTRPLAAFFPQRNRIISGLSKGTVIVEAAEKSGSLITAEFALSENRDVFAVPGGIYSPLSRGANRLIQQGAKLVTGADDILNEYSWSSGDQSEDNDEVSDLSPEERTVYEILSTDEPLTADDVIYRLHGRAEASNVSVILLNLELMGIITEDKNSAYIRKTKGR